jgi:hypothetical protein
MFARSFRTSRLGSVLAAAALTVAGAALVASVSGAAENSPSEAPAAPVGDKPVGDKSSPADKPRPQRAVLKAPVEQWRLIDSQSGPVNYYTVQREADRAFIRGTYQPPNKKAVLGFEVPESSRGRLRRLDWSWRAIKLPEQADECNSKKGDSPAVVYVTWRRTLRWYSLKFVWSATRPPGTICDRRRNAFVAQDTVVLESGGPLGVWKRESIDLWKLFRDHFEDGDKDADIPSLIGLGVMTDGDQTKTASTGDYADFVLSQ